MEALPSSDSLMVYIEMVFLQASIHWGGGGGLGKHCPPVIHRWCI